MQIDKAKLGSGDRDEFLKLARSIHKSEPRDRNANPLASQFFDADPSGVRPLSTTDLVESLAGAPNVEHDRWVEALAAGGYAAIALNRPDVAGDVSMIGGVRSGWTAPSKITPASGAKAVLAGKMEKAFARLAPDQRAALDRVAKADNPEHSGLLVEALKSICQQLLGASIENFNPSELKQKIAAAVKVNPGLRKRLTKALAA